MLLCKSLETTSNHFAPRYASSDRQPVELMIWKTCSNFHAGVQGVWTSGATGFILLVAISSALCLEVIAKIATYYYIDFHIHAYIYL